MATHSRETRRRKIVDRGAERLALITGQIHNLDVSSSAAQLQSNPEFDQQSASLGVAASSPPFDDDDGSLCSAIQGPANVDDGDTVTATTQECEASIGASESPIPEPGASGIGFRPSSMVAQQPAVRNSFSESATLRRKQKYAFISSKTVAAAISETEEYRLFSCVLIAILVVLSTWGFPLVGFSMVMSIICVRPLYLLLLSNVTLVVARILFHRQRDAGRPNRNTSHESGEGDWVERAGKALEASFVVKGVVDAMLLDFSVYAIIVICLQSLL